MSKATKYRFLLIMLLTLLNSVIMAQQLGLQEILKEELDREFNILSQADPAVYYMDYRVDDKKYFSLEANFGNIVGENSSQIRFCQPSLRIGDYAIDNTREIDSYGYGYGQQSIAQYIPINNNELAIKQALWRMTDQAYKSAKQKYNAVQNADLDDKLEVADFSKEEAIKFEGSPVQFEIDSLYWRELVKEVSALFKGKEGIISGKAYLSFEVTNKNFVSSEGSQLSQNLSLAQLHVVGEVVNEDNEVVSLYESFSGPRLEDIADKKVILDKARELVSKLDELKNASFAEPYTGPAILHPRVAAVFFHEIFGHRIEGHRLKSDSDGQTFKEKVGTRIVPEFINIYSDPTLAEFEGIKLNDIYQFDDQGVKAELVTVVEKGILKSFLMSRAPIDGFTNSNGHGRSEIGALPVARQSNLIIKADQTMTDDELRALLQEECRKQGKEYGYYFEDVTGGFTQTSRYSTNAFNIMPTLVYKIYADGRDDELVKGVDLIGTPLAMFAEVLAAGDEMGVFNGICGAESGNIPVSAVAPSILVRRIETQKKPVNERKSEEPLLASPELGHE